MASSRETSQQRDLVECVNVIVSDVVVSLTCWRSASARLRNDVRLTFGQVVSGPLLLGRTRHLGGGLLRPVH